MNYREILAVVGTVIALISYVPYFRDVATGKTKPHAFSWFIWGLLTAISFFSQVFEQAGPGMWVNGFTMVLCFIIFGFALLKGKKNIVTADWLLLGGALLAMLSWYITKTPVLSVILVTLTDFFGFLPTIRKSYLFPTEETLSTYALSALKWLLTFFALSHISIATALYPIYLIGADALFVVLLLVRRKALAVKVA